MLNEDVLEYLHISRVCLGASMRFGRIAEQKHVKADKTTLQDFVRALSRNEPDNYYNALTQGKGLVLLSKYFNIMVLKSEIEHIINYIDKHNIIPLAEKLAVKFKDLHDEAEECAAIAQENEARREDRI